jgi:hypothetical protein
MSLVRMSWGRKDTSPQKGSTSLGLATILIAPTLEGRPLGGLRELSMSFVGSNKSRRSATLQIRGALR